MRAREEGARADAKVKETREGTQARKSESEENQVLDERELPP